MIKHKGISGVKETSSTDGRVDKVADSQSIVIMARLVRILSMVEESKHCENMQGPCKNEEWQKNFEERAMCFVEQYTSTPVLLYMGKKILKTNLTNNGTYTLNENIADYGGVQLALKAWRNHQITHGSEPRFDAMQDFSNEQAFFIGYATHWCGRYSLDQTIYRLRTDEHSLYNFRVNSVLANIPEFAEAFHCAPGTHMNPKKRCSMY
ncbi:hypothetical protein Y032_0092g2524 [Ancylostoma ceylanicum]|uniref:Peptidase M13 C-terminal domain-containing protein n=1 Tax=Ancylostoma ceylanicum TaxID=53326 RepID=A0A016TLM5_9BILA|nr:hypothetical protein Y032_0092g2524 [Ancylostoma ceylanicum]